MDSRFLSFGTVAYAGTLFLFLLTALMQIPASQSAGPLVVVMSAAIAMTVFGLVAKGQAGYSRIGELAIIGLVLGIFGLLDLVVAGLNYQFTLNACYDSMLLPPDSGASWACPQVQASNLIMWVWGVGLVIPILLFLVAPSVQYLKERTQGSVVS